MRPVALTTSRNGRFICPECSQPVPRYYQQGGQCFECWLFAWYVLRRRELEPPHGTTHDPGSHSANNGQPLSTSSQSKPPRPTVPQLAQQAAALSRSEPQRFQAALAALTRSQRAAVQDHLSGQSARRIGRDTSKRAALRLLERAYVKIVENT